MTILRLLALTAFIFGIVAQPVLAQTNDLDQQVSAAIEKAKAHDQSFVDALCKQKGTAVLPYFSKHISDPDFWVRLAVEDAAASFDTEESRQMLVSLVSDKTSDVSDTALRDLNRLYSRRQLTRFGGQALKQNLVLRLRNQSASGLSILMLTYFPSDPTIINALKQFRATNHDDKLGLEGWLPVKTIIVTNAVLAELGDPEAIQRFKQTMMQGTPSDAVDVLATLSFINNPALLRQAIELLKDKRETERVRGGMGQLPPGSTVPPVTFLRVCDLALFVFATRPGINLGIDPEIRSRRPFTDAELSQAYFQLRTHFQSI